MTLETKLADANFDEMRRSTGRDGGPTCRGYFPLLKPTAKAFWNWFWRGEFQTSHCCLLFGWILDAVETGTEPLVIRCAPCKKNFGYREEAARLEAFDVPVRNVLQRSTRLPVVESSDGFNEHLIEQGKERLLGVLDGGKARTMRRMR